MTIDLQPQDISTLEFVQTIQGSQGPYCICTLPDIPFVSSALKLFQKLNISQRGELQQGIRGGLPWSGYCDASITYVRAHCIDFDHVQMEKQLELLDVFRVDPSIVTLPRRGLFCSRKGKYYIFE